MLLLYSRYQARQHDRVVDIVVELIVLTLQPQIQDWLVQTHKRVPGWWQYLGTLLQAVDVVDAEK